MSTRIEKEFVIGAGIHINDTFLINQYIINLSMMVETDIVREQSIAMDRIEYFLHHVFENSILLSDKESEVIEKYKLANLQTILLPDDPYDQIIGMVLLLKMNSILEGRLVITDLTIESKCSEGVRFHIISEIAETLYGDEGWWTVNSLRINDLENLKENKVVKLFENEWASLGLTWKEKIPKVKK